MYLVALVAVYVVIYLLLVIFFLWLSTHVWLQTLMGTPKPVISLRHTPPPPTPTLVDSPGSISSSIITLRVMSFNIFLRSWYRFWRDNPCNKQGDDTHERFDLWCKHYLPHYDIICLQEMYGIWNQRLKTLAQRAQTHGFDTMVIATDTPLQIDHGMCILTRIRPTKVQTHTFQDAVYVDKYSPKGFQHCVFSNPSGSSWHLIHTHIQSSYSYIDPKAIRTQHKQYRQLGAYIQTQCGSDPVLLVGDLNTSRKEDLEYLLNLCGLQDPWNSLHHTSEHRTATCWSTIHAKTGKELDTRYRVGSDKKLLQKGWLCLPRYSDHMLYRPGDTTPKLAVDTYEVCVLNTHQAHIERLSDHAAVTATIRLVTS